MMKFNSRQYCKILKEVDSINKKQKEKTIIFKFLNSKIIYLFMAVGLNRL